MKLQDVKIYISPLTQQAHLVETDGHIIKKEKYALSKNDLIEFLAGAAIGLEQELTNEFYVGDDHTRIDVKITRNWKEPSKEDLNTLKSAEEKQNE